MIAFTIYGEPVAQGRPRAGKSFDGTLVMFDPAKSRDYKRYVAMIASQHKPPALLTTAVTLTVKVYRPIPSKYMTKPKLAQIERGTLRPTSKPDLSNYIKGVEDAIESIILKNDSQVVDYSGSGKWYSDNPRIEIEIRELAE